VKIKLDSKHKECEKLKDELKKKEKTMEDKINMANCILSYSFIIFIENTKTLNDQCMALKAELKKAKDQNSELQSRIDDLE
jgi:hypothetical protein